MHTDYKSKIRNLLAIGTDAKTVKGEKFGWKTAILYLVPAGQLGIRDFCPHASAGCRQACLFKAGRGSFNNVIHSRKMKSLYFIHDRSNFIEQLHHEIRRFSEKFDRLCIRLNGTSDLPWENLISMEHFPKVQFYDYTKNLNRMHSFMAGRFPSNYHLTFSRSESNWKECKGILRYGGNVAAVFKEELPPSYCGYEVINGDLSDLRFQDGQFKIVGLKAKGPARKDASGFVIDAYGE